MSTTVPSEQVLVVGGIGLFVQVKLFVDKIFPAGQRHGAFVTPFGV
jgi:hypothetical protein